MLGKHSNPLSALKQKKTYLIFEIFINALVYADLLTKILLSFVQHLYPVLNFYFENKFFC